MENITCECILFMHRVILTHPPLFSNTPIFTRATYANTLDSIINYARKPQANAVASPNTNTSYSLTGHNPLPLVTLTGRHFLQVSFKNFVGTLGAPGCYKHPTHHMNKACFERSLEVMLSFASNCANTCIVAALLQYCAVVMQSFAFELNVI
jgi:hypothetical protein